MNKIFKTNSSSPLGVRGSLWLRGFLLVLAGLFLGWLFFHSGNKSTEKQQSTETKKQIWTCAMHPQIRQDHPGKCPICGMELIPVTDGGVKIDSNAVHFSKEAAELANVTTSVVSRQKPTKEVRLYGKVQADERLLQNQVAHIGGRIEKLLVNFTGEPVRKGQLLAVIYSPELVTAQQELLEAAKSKESQPEIYEAAKEKLMQWMLTERQIAQIESSGRVKMNFEVYSNTSGIVTAKRVNTGDHVSEGTVLFDVANLSNVWVLFDAYESDLPFLKVGNTISFTLQALPGTNFSANIRFIDPVIDPVNRVAKVRVEVSNAGGKLKPEMFATGVVKANLNEFKDKLVIPRSAVLWTGKRSIVYVKQAVGVVEGVNFKMREIELGPMLGNSYVVESGLKEGEEIVTDGTFSVDAAAQLAGKPSMMNHDEPKPKKVSSMPGMDM
ncbi:MAG TPA: efflux RND transporter periplasmic adaptor subunit [Paludibacter sp.]|nr:efflux RND transporter periplasmic adaptor subunit [Paludibacter sp.]